VACAARNAAGNEMAVLIDIAVPGDTRVEENEQDKMGKYQNLARELKKLWKVNTNIIPTLVGALGTTPESLEKNLKRSETMENIRKLHAWEQHKYSETDRKDSVTNKLDIEVFKLSSLNMTKIHQHRSIVCENHAIIVVGY